MANGLLDLLGGAFGTSPPDYMQGLLGADAVENLRKRSIGSGLVNALIGYAAAPKNQNLGLGRILASAAQSGIQGAQGVYQNATQDYMTQEKIAEMGRQKDKQARLQTMLGGITDPNERMLAELNPDAYVTGKLKPTTQRKTFVAPDGSIRFDDTAELATTENVAAPKESPFKVGATRDFVRGSQRITEEYQQDGTWKPIASGAAHGQGINVTYGAPVSGLDAQGNPVFFQPDKGGGAPSIIPNVTPVPQVTAQPTESQAKSATFFGQMTSATDELNRLYKEGFNPNKYGSQIETLAAGTIGTALVSSQAQRARQAQEQWAEAFLRIKTGAAATEGEVNRNVKTFFPSFGDKPANIAQKERARLKAEQDVLKMTKQPQVRNKPIIPNGALMPTRSRQDILNEYGVK